MKNKKGINGVSTSNGHNGHNGHNGYNGHNGVHAANGSGTSVKDKSKNYRPSDKEPFMTALSRETIPDVLLEFE